MSNKFTTFSPRQKLILSWWTPESKYHEYDGIIADGSIRSGKSVSMSMSFIFWAMECFESRNFALCGVTIGALRRNVVDELLETIKRHGYKVVERKGAGLIMITKNKKTNKFYLFSGYDERSQDAIQGITLAGVLFDEVALMPESFVNQATGRCSVDGSKLWFNCNPAGSRVHWFKANWINQCHEKKILYLHFTMDDNLSLSERTKERYRSMYTGVFYRRYIEGRWVAAEGAIYGMWDMDLNSYTTETAPLDYEHEYRRLVSIDYGTANPMVFLDAYDDGTVFWIKQEYYYDSRKTQVTKTDEEYADDFEKFVGYDHTVQVILDPSALSFRMVLRNRGYRVKDADNAVLDGIRITSTLIKQRRIKVIRENCPNFLREVNSYIWDEKGVLLGEERPLKENDHAMDAMRYLCKTIVNRRRLAL